MTPWMSRAMWAIFFALAGYNLANLGWRVFVVTWVLAAVIGAALLAVLLLIGRAEQFVKGRSALRVRTPAGERFDIPIRFCPNCGVRLVRGGDEHVRGCGKAVA